MFPDETVAAILANYGAFWLESFTWRGKYLAGANDLHNNMLWL
jgi:hypothetical protein